MGVCFTPLPWIQPPLIRGWWGTTLHSGQGRWPNGQPAPVFYTPRCLAMMVLSPTFSTNLKPGELPCGQGIWLVLTRFGLDRIQSRTKTIFCRHQSPAFQLYWVWALLPATIFFFLVFIFS